MQQTRAVRERYDRLAGAYDRRWAEYISASARHTLARARIVDGETVLDIGCGTGALSKAAGRDIVGVDVSPGMLRRAFGARVAADAAALPLRAKTFDVVLSASSLHYWPEPVRTLVEMRRVMKPGGRLILTDWCDDYLACRLCDRLLRIVARAYVRAYGVMELGTIITQAGFREVSIDHYKIGAIWGLMTAVATA